MFSIYSNLTRSLLFVYVIIIFSFSSPSDGSDIDSLNSSQLKTLDSICAHYHIDYCCNSSISKCVNQKPECTIAKRLYEFTGWLINIDTEPETIVTQIDKRYAGFTSSDKKVIDTTNLPWAGNAKAPVIITAYVSSTCNLGKHIVGVLYDSVTTGNLKDKAKLMAKPFGSGIGDIGLFAGNAEGKFWELFNEMRKNKIRYKEGDIVDMAKKAGIPEKKFRKQLKKGGFSKMLDNTRAEGSQNGVKIVPTFFINGKRYQSYKDPEWVIDAALFEHEKISKEIR